MSTLVQTGTPEPGAPRAVVHQRLDGDEGLDPDRESELAQLCASCFPDCTEDEAPAAADWRWFTLIDGRLASHAAIRRFEWGVPRGLSVGHLCYVATWPELRGRGLAAALLKRIQRDAPAIGLDVVILHAAADAVGLYHRLGWQPIAPCASYANTGRDDPDPVLGWSPRPERLAALHTDCFVFPEDW